MKSRSSLSCCVLSALTFWTTACSTSNVPQTPVAPPVSWSAPAPIAYGTPLGTTQLDAQAKVPGQFSYTPAAGSVLEVGTQTLQATFTPKDRARYTPVTVSTTLNVTQDAPSITWPDPDPINYGTALGAAQLNATTNVPGQFTFNPGLGTILQSGVHTLLATFTPADATHFRSVTASVTIMVHQAVPVLTWATPAAIAYNTALSAAELNAVTNVPGTFAYSPAPGTILNAGSHSLSVTFTPTDARNYTAVRASATLQVNPNNPVLSWPPPAAISYGTALSAKQLNATTSVPGAFSYSPASGAILTAGTQTLSVTFTPIDQKNYSSATAETTVQVESAIPVITWPAPAAIPYGIALGAAQLNASTNIKGTFSYSPSAGAVLHAGIQTLTATFTPADSQNYATGSVQVSLHVNQAIPSLQLAAPFPLAVNMPLSAAGFAVTAANPVTKGAVAGTVAWTPGLDSHFSSPGPQQITAVFTPSDAVDYAPAQITTTTNIQPFGVVCWGDSITGGYPTFLSKLLTLPVVNMAAGGLTSTQMAVRSGAIPTDATINEGAIPASGSVGILFRTGYEPLNPYGQNPAIAGSIAGIEGIVTYTPQTLLFTRNVNGDPVPVAHSAPFTVDTPYSQYIPIFWEGRNNISSRVVDDIAAQVAMIPSGQDYLVFPILNGDMLTEHAGTSWYRQIMGINNQLANIYGSHFLDVRKRLIESYDPTSVLDTADYQHDVSPTSLRNILGSGQLPGAIAADDTTFDVYLKTGTLTKKMILTIDSGANAENVQISSVSGSAVTVVRGVSGASHAHPAGTAVTEVDWVHLGPKGWKIVADAVADYLAQYKK